MNRLDTADDQAMVEDYPMRRVRDEVKDGVKVAAASIAASVGLVLVATLLMRLVG